MKKEINKNRLDVEKVEQAGNRLLNMALQQIIRIGDKGSEMGARELGRLAEQLADATKEEEKSLSVVESMAIRKILVDFISIFSSGDDDLIDKIFPDTGIDTVVSTACFGKELLLFAMASDQNIFRMVYEDE